MASSLDRKSGQPTLSANRIPATVARYTEVLHPWVTGDMDRVIRIEPGMVTGFELIEDEPQHRDLALRT